MKSRSWPLRMILLTIALAGPTHAAAAQDIPGACAADTLCLAGGRFQITVDWQTATGPGPGHPVLLTANTGYFWFFDSANVEMLVKVLDACQDYGREWVFAGGLTDVGVTMTVMDVQTGISHTYTNPQGTAFLPIQDTGTFSCTDSGPLTGAWTGTFDSVGDHFFYDCDSNVPARATFTQQGSVVDGILSADPRGCGFNDVTFHGTLDGDTLEGTISGGGPHYGFAEGSTAVGTLSGTKLTLALTNHNRYHPSPIPGGVIQLYR